MNIFIIITGLFLLLLVVYLLNKSINYKKDLMYCLEMKKCNLCGWVSGITDINLHKNMKNCPKCDKEYKEIFFQ